MGGGGGCVRGQRWPGASSGLRAGQQRRCSADGSIGRCCQLYRTLTPRQLPRTSSSFLMSALIDSREAYLASLEDRTPVPRAAVQRRYKGGGAEGAVQRVGYGGCSPTRGPTRGDCNGRLGRGEGGGRGKGHGLPGGRLAGRLSSQQRRGVHGSANPSAGSRGTGATPTPCYIAPPLRNPSSAPPRPHTCATPPLAAPHPRRQHHRPRRRSPRLRMVAVAAGGGRGDRGGKATASWHRP